MLKFFSIVMLATLVLLMNTPVFATSWVEIDPKEVVNRADVVVSGTYDFSDERKESEFIFHGVAFNVSKVYKGDNISKKITAGLDPFDDGWVDEFQRAGGEFLLFLENSAEADFLVPVGGPNGMIQLKNGKVVHPVDTKRVFFEEFLKSVEEKPAVPALPKSEPAKPEPVKSAEDRRPVLTLTVGIGVLVCIGAGIFLKRRK
ncbi:hypothetical protein [Bacillus sp. EB01]|uniref:hypothetical protein n=1 Tax=Bacillus sp. EB01 TaxID=1347086 RepID=UPI000693F031|nr:hypothetical protein [Bacillus sp. EB01]